MDASQRRLTKGQTVRCRNGEQSLMGTVLMASEGNARLSSGADAAIAWLAS